MSLDFLPKELEDIINDYILELQHQNNFNKFSIELKERLDYRNKNIFYNFYINNKNRFYSSFNYTCFIGDSLKTDFGTHNDITYFKKYGMEKFEDEINILRQQQQARIKGYFNFLIFFIITYIISFIIIGFLFFF